MNALPSDCCLTDSFPHSTLRSDALSKEEWCLIIPCEVSSPQLQWLLSKDNLWWATLSNIYAFVMSPLMESGLALGFTLASEMWQRERVPIWGLYPKDIQTCGHLIWRANIGKDPDAEKEWRQKEKRAAEDEMIGWHHRHNGQTLGDNKGQGSLMYRSLWSHKQPGKIE